jgi:hypothetical protein
MFKRKGLTERMKKTNKKKLQREIGTYPEEQKKEKNR